MQNSLAPFFCRKPPALTSINHRESAINPEIAPITVCQRPLFCEFPPFSVKILTASLQIGTHTKGFSAQFPTKKRAREFAHYWFEVLTARGVPGPSRNLLRRGGSHSMALHMTEEDGNGHGGTSRIYSGCFKRSFAEGALASLEVASLQNFHTEPKLLRSLLWQRPKTLSKSLRETSGNCESSGAWRGCPWRGWNF